MPDDRFLHRCQGQSDKLGQVDHLTYRVWTQYLLSADDYGVMPFSAAVIRGDNRALRHELETEIQAALLRLAEVGLVERFTHQGEEYCCSVKWQDFQRIRWPRKSYHPSPPPELLQKFSRKTAALLKKRNRKMSRSLTDSDTGLWLTANKKEEERRGRAMDATINKLSRAEKSALAERAGRFCEGYTCWYREERDGALYPLNPVRDYGYATRLVFYWPDAAHLEKMARLFLRANDVPRNLEARTIGQFWSQAPACDAAVRRNAA